MLKTGENIYKRKDGRWEGRYMKGRKPSGRVIYGYVYAYSYKEVKEKLQQAKSGRNAASKPGVPDSTISKLSNLWLEKQKAQITECSEGYRRISD